MDGGDRTLERLSAWERPYAPSWLDRLTDAVRRIPVPFPLVYLVLGILLALVRTAIGWADGSYPFGTFFGIHVLDGLNPVYFLFAIHFIDNTAARAITEFRPKLTDDADFAMLRYRLTTMPAVPALVFGLLGLAGGAIYLPLLLSPVDLDLSHYFTSPAAVVVDTFLSALLGLAQVTFAYHALRQLRLVSRISTQHTDFNIFDIGPLHALSRVAAVTAVALVVFSYVYLAFYANWQINSVSNAILLGGILLLAVLTFVVPLYGSHRLLKQAKDRRLSEIGRAIEAAADTLHATARDGSYSADSGNVQSVLDGLLNERTLVARAPTWPWDPETVRAVATAILLPILLWFATRLLERFIG